MEGHLAIRRVFRRTFARGGWRRARWRGPTFGWRFVSGLLISFCYFRFWALVALRGQPFFGPKWALGLAYDLTAFGLWSLFLAFVWGRREHSAPWLKGSALLLVFSNWVNFELLRHVGQPFLPQALGLLSPRDLFDAYGVQLVWGSLHPVHLIGALGVPGVLVLASRAGRVAGRSSVSLPLLGAPAMGLLLPLLVGRLFPAVHTPPRTLTWNFYGHGAFHWAAYLWHGDEASGALDVPALTPRELEELDAVVGRYFDDGCHERPMREHALFRRPVPCTGAEEDDEPHAMGPGRGALPLQPTSSRDAGGSNRGKNVVLIHLESFRAASFDGLSHVWQGITPRLARLMEESAYFTRAFTNNVPTDRSLTSMLCSTPVPGVALSRMDRPRPRVTCLPELLRDAGYRNVRMSGIPSGFQKLGGFFAEYGVTETYGSVELQEQFPHPELEPLGTAGYDVEMLYDERLFHAARAWLLEHRANHPRRPFFMLLETMTNHLPWDLPDSRRMPLERYRAMSQGPELTGTEETARMHRTMRLTDDYVADFVDWFRRQEGGLLADESIFVFYSDHPPWFPEPSFERYPLVVKESWIPLFIWGVDADRRGAFEHPVSLYDVAPTLLVLLEVGGGHAFVGKDLFDVRAERWFTFSQREGTRGFFASGEDWVLEDGARVRLRSDMTFVPLTSLAGPEGLERALVRSEKSFDLIERFAHRALLVDRALRPPASRLR